MNLILYKPGSLFLLIQFSKHAADVVKEAMKLQLTSLVLSRLNLNNGLSSAVVVECYYILSCFVTVSLCNCKS